MGGKSVSKYRVLSGTGQSPISADVRGTDVTNAEPTLRKCLCSLVFARPLAACRHIFLLLFEFTSVICSTSRSQTCAA